MPYLVAIFWGAFGLTLRSLVGRVLIALGISYITYQGVDTLINGLEAAALSHLSGVNAELLGVVGLARVGESLSVVVSALSAKYAIQGLTGSFSKMVIK